MTMRIYKPGKADILDGVIIAVLLIVINYTKDFAAPHLSQFTEKLGEWSDFMNTVIVGFILGVVLTLVGKPRYATLVFALALGIGIYGVASEKLNV